MKCEQCGLEAPEYYIRPNKRGRLECYGCHLDAHIPRWYHILERYRWDEVWGHENATKRPALGVTFLDRRGPKVKEMVKAKVRLR